MVQLKDILASLAHISIVGSVEKEIDRPEQIDSISLDDTCITWLSDNRIELQGTITTGTIICSRKLTRFHPNCTYIIVQNPRSSFLEVVSTFFDVVPEPFISTNSFIHPSVSIGKNVTVDHFAVIEEGCILGDGCIIGSGTILRKNTWIGKGVKLGSNNTIGGVGFGYEKDDDGRYRLMPHLGNVVIEDNVEVGNNTCIDRAMMGSTIVGRNTKIDNLVHIAHGVKIGENTLVIANSMIGGSTVIGENVWIAPSVSILNKKHVHGNSVIGMGAVVIRDVNEGETVIGNPGKPLIK
jgi:UDP-3-O-[3-hydroxymyristoyl] glucosamine N-acyltransferase